MRKPTVSVWIEKNQRFEDAIEDLISNSFFNISIITIDADIVISDQLSKIQTSSKCGIYVANSRERSRISNLKNIYFMQYGNFWVECPTDIKLFDIATEHIVSPFFIGTKRNSTEKIFLPTFLSEWITAPCMKV